MGSSCSMHMRDEKFLQDSGVKTCLEDLDERIILRVF